MLSKYILNNFRTDFHVGFGFLTFAKIYCFDISTDVLLSSEVPTSEEVNDVTNKSKATT